jgi:exopolyphosphatase / guanosine-5'-triphosphate,3'-diphosphate pyrophosphatase
MTNPRKTLAAVDMGSNSFRLTIVEVQDSGLGLVLKPIEDIKETVRLAAGLDSKQRLDRAAQERGLLALNRFAERLKGFDPKDMRAVGTSTLRVAKNIDDFLPLAQHTLGFPIEIISGREEARLIYNGASHALAHDVQKRLVIDIGGGSTECVLGEGYESLVMESARVGCLSITSEFFPEGAISAKSFNKAYIAARGRIAEFSAEFLRHGWSKAYGTSGTARSAQQIAQALFRSNSIRRKDLNLIRDKILAFDHVDAIPFEGLREDRRSVFPGGLATLMAVMDELEVSEMEYCTGALREGVLYDLIGRQSHSDMRNASIANLARRHNADPAQASRIERTAQKFFDQLTQRHQLSDDIHANDIEQVRTLLSWAAQVHEVGLVIGHDHYHKHSAYIVEHAEIAGFSQTEQDHLGLLLLSHRGKLGKIVDKMPSAILWRAIIAFRASAIVHRRRDDRDPPIKIELKDQRLKVSIAQSWLDQHALTDHLFETECNDWIKTKAFKEVKFDRT